jgi:hypothetical protein
VVYLGSGFGRGGVWGRRSPVGRRVYSNAVAAIILRRRHPLELQRGMQRPFLLRPMIQVADGLQIGLRRTSRLGGGMLLSHFTFQQSPLTLRHIIDKP